MAYNFRIKFDWYEECRNTSRIAQGHCLICREHGEIVRVCLTIRNLFAHVHNMCNTNVAQCLRYFANRMNVILIIDALQSCFMLFSTFT